MDRKTLLVAVLSASALVLATSAHARRAYETEYQFYSANGSGTVLYPCLGGAYYFWDDGVQRTRAQSELLLDQVSVTLTAISGIQSNCADPLGPRAQCAKEFHLTGPDATPPDELPTTWEEAMTKCQPWYLDTPWG